jgi:hypothetical protein
MSPNPLMSLLHVQIAYVYIIQFALNELVEQLWCCTMHVYGLSQILKEYSDMPHTHTHTHTHSWDNKVFIWKTTILQGNCLKLCAQNIKIHVLATNMANIKKKDSNYRCALSHCTESKFASTECNKTFFPYILIYGPMCDWRFHHTRIWKLYIALEATDKILQTARIF